MPEDKPIKWAIPLQWGAAMFTKENSDYTPMDRIVLNGALEELLLGEPESDGRGEIEQSYSDLLSNAWRPGLTTDDLVEAVKQRLGRA